MQRKKWKQRVCLILCMALFIQRNTMAEAFSVTLPEPKSVEQKIRQSEQAVTASESAVTASGPAVTITPSQETVPPTSSPQETMMPQTSLQPPVFLAPAKEPEETAKPSQTDMPSPSKKLVKWLARPGKVRHIRICYGRTNHRLQIRWKKAVRTKKYIIYRSVNGGKFRHAGSTAKCHFVDKGIREWKKYKYKIVSYQPKARPKMNHRISTVFSTAGIVGTGHACYSYREMCGDISQLKAAYGSRVHVRVIGKSADGRNLYDVILGNPKAKKTMLVVSNLHAREYMTAQLCMAQIEYYLKNYNRSVSGTVPAKIFKDVAVHYVPMANPDGVTISQYGIGAIRSASLRSALYKMPGAGNHRAWKANAKGVDLNRNYPESYRANYQTRGSEGYSGPYAASEPETRAVISLIKSLKNRSGLRGVVNYHAMGSIAFGGTRRAGTIRNRTAAMYRRAVALTGYGSSAGYAAGTPTVGNLREYLVNKQNIPSITLEIGLGSCPVSSSQFPSVWHKNYRLVLEEAKLLK